MYGKQFYPILSCAGDNSALSVIHKHYIILHCITFRVKMPEHFSHFTDALNLTVKISYGKDN